MGKNYRSIIDLKIHKCSEVVFGVFDKKSFMGSKAAFYTVKVIP